MGENLTYKYKKIVTDAGYESEENYVWLEGNGQLSFIKPMNYEISKTRIYKSDISRIENKEYDEEKDTYTCRNGKELSAVRVKREKTKTG